MSCEAPVIGSLKFQLMERSEAPSANPVTLIGTWFNTEGAVAVGDVRLPELSNVSVPVAMGFVEPELDDSAEGGILTE